MYFGNNHIFKSHKSRKNIISCLPVLYGLAGSEHCANFHLHHYKCVESKILKPKVFVCVENYANMTNSGVKISPAKTKTEINSNAVENILCCLYFIFLIFNF